MRTHRLATGGTVALEPTRSTASAAAAAGFGVDGRSPTRAELLMAHEAATVPAICPLPSIEPPWSGPTPLTVCAITTAPAERQALPLPE